MRRSLVLTVIVAGTIGGFGCAGEPTSPFATSAPETTLRASAGLAAAGLVGPAIERAPQYLVVFDNGRVPNGFRERVEALGGTVTLVFEHGGAANVSGLSEAALAELRGSSHVRLVEPEILFRLPRSVVEPQVQLAGAVPASPSDPSAALFFPAQWNLRAIGADVAWAAGHLGSADVTVAILDTGIGYTHVDLEGLVDLDRSVSFLPVEDSLVELNFPGAHPIADLGFHGTHVAATVASNGLAAAGVTSRTRLMGVKVCAGHLEMPLCPTGAILAGIEYAVENGADIINMSLGGAFTKRGSPGFVSVINRLFNYARRNGVTIVIAAGNESADLDHDFFPVENEDGIPVLTHLPSLFHVFCDAPHVICVSATAPTASESIVGPWVNVDAPAFYTNFGRSAISVAAPGGNNAGVVWAACSTFSLRFSECQSNGFVLPLAGTSMAAPHVSGLAALLAAEQTSKPSQIRQAIEHAADDLGEPGTDPFYGRGRINVASALGAN